MSVGLKRRCADLTCRTLQRVLPAELKVWGRAVRSEVAGIPDDSEALSYALQSFRGFLPRAVLAHLFPSDASLETDNLSSNHDIGGDMVRNPRAVGILCAVGAVLLGAAYMIAAGAPLRYLVINIAALLIGLVMLVIADRVSFATRRWSSVAALAAAGALLATALFGEQVDSAARWVRLGPIVVQPSLILLPPMIVAFARSRDAVSTLAIILAAAGLGVQPDRAMAGVLAMAIVLLAVRQPDRFTLTALAGGVGGLAAALGQADSLPAVPYVDQILYSSFQVHPLAGAAVLAGSLLLVVPAILGWREDEAHRDVYLALGAVWSAAIIAAALGNYPTPLVGYGGSAIIGYVLCLTILPRRAASTLAVGVGRSDEADGQAVDKDLRLGLPLTAA